MDDAQEVCLFCLHGLYLNLFGIFIWKPVSCEVDIFLKENVKTWSLNCTLIVKLSKTELHGGIGRY